METVQGGMLLVYTLIAIVALIVMIAKFRIYPFLVLIIVSLGLALAVGMPMDGIVKSYEAGTGKTLGHLAIVIALGTMLGKMMAESGGAERIAITLIKWFGEKHIHWAMMFIALIVGLPVFFEVGFVLLIPIAFNIAKRTGKSLLIVGLPMVAGLSVVHGLIPPHPAVQAYHADIGKTIMYSLLVGVPTAVVAGPLYALWINKYVKLPENNPLAKQFVEADANNTRELPSFGITLFTIMLPVALMLVGSWADVFFAPKTFPNELLRFIGTSDIALLIAVLVSFITFGTMQGFNREQIEKFCGGCLASIAGILLIVGAGGGFGGILRDSGISNEIVSTALKANLSPLLLGWLVAALIRLATGSATVAMATACSIVAPIAAAAGVVVRPELLVLATGSGSLIFSHVNDAGFWLIKEYFGMTVGQTLKTWSVLETIISVLGLSFTLLLSAVL
ncbi:gluconate:H+ symporter [Acinetobacter baumannii]|nr:gluconate permease [Acinetobacter baumannii]EKX7031776.1 gluconate permease [Acinetobacter baumannii]EKX7938717.1 gluconate permease [Acinetobacter baumannii]EKX8230333.1 gluconate permease [Acinetobacter baumannii]EMD0958995.1 gluconate permease [Acinetobacter baumannii]